MKAINNLFPLFAGLFFFAACSQSQSAPPAATNSPAAPGASATNSTSATDKEVALIKTTEGDMVVEFWTDAAPDTIANFKKLSKSGFYDGTAFHRIIKGFMIQGGDPLTRNPVKDRPSPTIKDEKNAHLHERGVIAMANTGEPNSASSQFYICLAPQPRLDRLNYTTFGKLIKGDDILEKIGDTPVGPSPRGEPSAPQKRVEIISITIVPASSIK